MSEHRGTIATAAVLVAVLAGFWWWWQGKLEHRLEGTWVLDASAYRIVDGNLSEEARQELLDAGHEERETLRLDGDEYEVAIGSPDVLSGEPRGKWAVEEGADRPLLTFTPYGYGKSRAGTESFGDNASQPHYMELTVVDDDTIELSRTDSLIGDRDATAKVVVTYRRFDP